jgi:hypothetical protein
MNHDPRYPVSSQFSQTSRRPWSWSGSLGVGAVLFLLISPSLAMAGGTKVPICHKPPGDPTNHQLISISENAYATHVAHGDTPVGPEVCDGVDNDCNGIIDDQVAADADCHDGIACTLDACTAGACSHPPDNGVCAAGEACEPTSGCVEAGLCPCATDIINGSWTTAAVQNPQSCTIGDPNTVEETREAVVLQNEPRFLSMTPDATQSSAEVVYGIRVENIFFEICQEVVLSQAELSACLVFFSDPAAAAQCLTPQVP